MNENNLFDGLGLTTINNYEKLKEVEGMFEKEKQKKVWNTFKSDFNVQEKRKQNHN